MKHIYRFDEIAVNSTKKVKPQESDKEHYIGLEHIDPECLYITRWGSDVAPVGEKLLMKKGDVLFGKRRAYQRKVAIAPIDGIFSAHGLVLRPKEDVIDKDFFPFFISSDEFLNRAVQISVGGLSPTVNWGDLARQEFALPSLDEQKVLADKLWAAYRVKESYRKLLAATDDMVTARFINMFGSASDSNITLKDVADIFDGTHQTPQYTNEGIRFVSVENISNLLQSTKYISREAFDKYKHKPQKGDVLMTRIGSIGKCAVVPNNDDLAYYVSLALIKPDQNKIDSVYLKYYLESGEGQRELRKRSLLKAFPMKINLGEIGKVNIILPSKCDQQRFVDIATQAEATKASLRQSIESIDRVIKSLINQ